MRRTLEAVFRYPLQFLMLIVLLPIVGVAVMYFMIPRTYASTASVWALQRYFIVSSTGQESNLQETEAQTQADALTELLQTRSFVDAVVKGIDLAPTLGLDTSVTSNPQMLETALFNEISKHVVVTPSDAYLFEISYANRNPHIAQQIVASIIATYGVQGLGLSISGGETLLGGYQTQLASAQKNLNTAINTETQYAREHPNQTPNQLLTSDSQYALLDAQKVQDQATVQNIQTTINTIQQEINTQGSQSATLFKVVDPPLLPYQPVSRSKNYIVGGGIGLAVALLTCVIYLLVVVRRDRGVYSAYELQELVAFPVIMQLPSLSAASMSLVTIPKMRPDSMLPVGNHRVNGHIPRLS